LLPPIASIISTEGATPAFDIMRAIAEMLTVVMFETVAYTITVTVVPASWVCSHVGSVMLAPTLLTIAIRSELASISQKPYPLAPAAALTERVPESYARVL